MVPCSPLTTIKSHARRWMAGGRRRVGTHSLRKESRATRLVTPGRSPAHREIGVYVNGKKQPPNSQTNTPRKLSITDSPLDWVIRPFPTSGSTADQCRQANSYLLKVRRREHYDSFISDKTGAGLAPGLNHKSTITIPNVCNRSRAGSRRVGVNRKMARRHRFNCWIREKNLCPPP